MSTNNTHPLNNLEDAISEIRRHRVSREANLVIYTAIFGEYDRLSEPRLSCANRGIDFVCFTDNRNLSSNIWKITYVDFIFRDPRRTARLFKCLPHILFPCYHESVWLDGNFELSEPFVPYLKSQENYQFLCFRHPSRNCLYQEAKACLSKGKDEPNLIRFQIDNYALQGMPENYGMIASGVLVRKHHDRNVIRFCDHWLLEINEHSVRDQLAFPYVAWKQAFSYNLFPTSMVHAPGLLYRAHSKWVFYDHKGRKMPSLKNYFWGLYYKLRVR